ncbi:MAG: DMT family transporter [Actinomycetota bacterium]|nr:DMT family transporter [Actinomycetota bacterium]
MNDTHLSSQIPGISFAVGAAVAFGTLAIFAKYAYREGADPVALLSVRFAAAACIVAVFRALQRGRRKSSRDQVIRLILLGGLGYAFEASLFFAALQNAPAAVVSLVFYSYPLWTALLGFAIGLERFRPQFLVALVLGSVGVVVIFSAPIGGLKGPLLALAAAVAVAVYFIAVQVFTKGVDASSSALWTSAGAAASTAVIAPLAGQSIPLSALPPAFALGLASAVAFLLLFAAIARIGSPRSAVAAMMEPVTTVVLAAVFLNEVITGRVIAGTVLVVAALPVLALTGPAPPEPSLG